MKLLSYYLATLFLFAFPCLAQDIQATGKLHCSNLLSSDCRSYTVCTSPKQTELSPSPSTQRYAAGRVRG